MKSLILALTLTLALATHQSSGAQCSKCLDNPKNKFCIYQKSFKCCALGDNTGICNTHQANITCSNSQK